ncbi:MAG TPA: prepilin-type N-terminal cleavage/methylation domain-containing protein [Chthoniobacterales bacterium]|jgi:type II secretory pathway pseudopilin PulG
MERHPQKDYAGFTLVELLIATAIVVFIVVMLGQILSATQTMWRNSEARTDPFRDSRAAIDLISRQLAQAVTNDKAPVLTLENLYVQDKDDPTDGPANNQQVYALVPMKNASKSDICAVGFYCTWSTSKHAYVLRRHFMDSDRTFSHMQDAGLPSTPNPLTGNGVFVPSLDSPTQDEDLAAYVWDLKIVPYESNAGALNPNTTYPLTYHGTLPQFLEISFKAISPQSANKLTAQGVTTKLWFDLNNSMYKNQILPQMHQFVTRIKLSNALMP